MATLLHPDRDAKDEVCIGVRTYFLSLGSNTGDRHKNLQEAARRFTEAGIHILKSSSLYETKPVDFKNQPDFLNQVVEIKTGMRPSELLRAVKKIEKECGRTKTVRFGPRTLDVDILWWEGGGVQRKNLMIPHVRATQRKFVLVPWMEIAGKNFMLSGKPLGEWLSQLDKQNENQNIKLYKSQGRKRSK